MDVKNDGSDSKTSNSFNSDSCFDKKISYPKDNREDVVMAKPIPVNFSPAKFAFFYNDMNVNSTEPSQMDSYDRERFKNDKASFFRTDVLLSPKYRGKVNPFDSSFEDFETQLTKIDSIPIKSDESLDYITEKKDASDLSSQDTCSTLSAETDTPSNTPDHSIFTLISPSKFKPRLKDNRLSISSDSKVELMKSQLRTNHKEEGNDNEDEGERTPTSQSFHDISEEFLAKHDLDLVSSNLKKVDKYSTIATFNLEKNSPDEVDDSSCLRRIQKLKSIRAGNLTSRFSKSQETYQMQSDPDDTSDLDLDMSRKEDFDFDDESVAISLDPMDGNYDSTSLVSDNTENCTAAPHVEAQCESEPPNRSISLSSDDADEDDVISSDLVFFVRNFDRQTAREGRFQEGKNIKMGVEKIPNDEEFILGNSVQTKKKFKKNFQLPTEERLSPTKHQNGNKPERSTASCQHGNVESSPTSPLKKYTSVLSKNISLKSPLPLFSLPADQESDPENFVESPEVDETFKHFSKSSASPTSSCRTKQASPEPCLISDRKPLDENNPEESAPRDVDSEGDSSSDSNEYLGGLTAGQRMLLADFKFGSQRGSREKERPSAARLAKRLYHLHGFKRSDITRHLSKRNSFALLVGEEFLKYFDFSGERLDDSLRIFLKNLTFIQEIPCDKDRIVQHFAHRYVECNPGRFENEALVHSLSYALLILDNDLNNQRDTSMGFHTTVQKVTSQDFVENFIESQMNAGVEIPDSVTRDFLHQLYQSIRNEPIELQIEEAQTVPSLQQTPQQRGQMLPMAQAAPSPYNVLAADNGASNVGRNGLQVMTALEKNSTADSDDQLELKKGYIMRKCCLDANGRKTGLGRRGWKMFYAVLRDTTLYLYSSERASKSKKSRRTGSIPSSSKSSIQLNSEGSASSTPKKSIGNSLKDKVLGKLSRSSRNKTGSQESGIANVASADDEEESGNSLSIGAGDELDDESTGNECDDDAQSKLDSMGDWRNPEGLRDGTLPRDSKPPEQGSRASVPVANGSNAICLLHSIATKATDYIKKSHVFRLHTVDRAQYLIQTSDMKECQDWIDCINVVAALNSAPIPSRNFDVHKWFDRPITNLECSTLSIREQIVQHERASAQYEKQLFEYRKAAPEKGSRNRVIREYCHKENFLKFEIKRFKLYTKLLQYQLSTCPQLEPSLAETTIGEVEEPSCSPVGSTPPAFFEESPSSTSNREEVKTSPTQEEIILLDKTEHPGSQSSSSSSVPHNNCLASSSGFQRAGDESITSCISDTALVSAVNDGNTTTPCLKPTGNAQVLSSDTLST